MSQQDDTTNIANIAQGLRDLGDTLSSLMTSAELGMHQAERGSRERSCLADASHSIAGVSSFIAVLAEVIAQDVESGDGTQLQHMMAATSVMQTVALWESSQL